VSYHDRVRRVIIPMLKMRSRDLDSIKAKCAWTILAVCRAGG
jgi:hypothetical protein